MPFISNMPEDDQQKNPSQGAVPATGGAPVQLSPSSGVIGAGSPTTAGASPQGGSFATLDKYLSANQGQAEPLANKLTTGIGQQYNTLAGQNTSTLQGIEQNVANAPGYTPSSPGVLAAEAANPVSFASDQGNVKQFQGLINNAYGGPLSAESTPEYTKQQDTINQAIAQGNQQTSSEAGRAQLLSQNEAAPSTSVTGLNEAILSQSPTALNKVESAYKPFSNLLTGLSSGAQNTNAQIAKEQTDAAASSKAAQDAIAQQMGAVNTGITGRLMAAQQAATKQQTDLSKELGSLYSQPIDTTPFVENAFGRGNSVSLPNATNYSVGNLSPQALQSLGITQDQWTPLLAALQQASTSQYMTGHNFGAPSPTAQLDLNQWLQTQNPQTAITAQNIATPEDYARASALSQLAGTSVPLSSLITPATVAQAGTAPTALNNFDYASALKSAQDTAAAERAYGQQVANTLTNQADIAHAAGERGGFLGGFNPLSYILNPSLALSKSTIDLAKKNAGKI